MFISKIEYQYLFENYRHFKMDSFLYRERYRELKVKFDELDSRFFSMRQSKIYWKNRCCELEEKIVQDKISFAVEQLEKVKELFLIESKEYPIIYNISDDIVGGAIDKDKCFEIIDNQIEQLKRL